jgi:hypothetical protein
MCKIYTLHISADMKVGGIGDVHIIKWCKTRQDEVVIMINEFIVAKSPFVIDLFIKGWDL